MSDLLRIAIAGNPNSGKTTLFNALTGSTAHVGNWPGVTVEKKEGSYRHEATDTLVQITDLPGIYSLTAASEDERIALEFILFDKTDLFVNIVDASNLERNLYLTVQLLEMRKPVLVVLNMLDIAKSRHIEIDIPELSKRLGCPVVGSVAINKQDAEIIKDAIVKAAVNPEISSLEILYPEEITTWVDGHVNSFKKTAALMKSSPSWVALRILENTPLVTEKAAYNKELNNKEIEESLSYLWRSYPTDVEISESRYKYVHHIADIVTKTLKQGVTYSEKIDNIVLNRALGIPIFFLFMYVVFWLTQVIGGAFIDFFDISFGAVFVEGLSRVIISLGLPDILVTILANGVGVGIQTVSTFIPIVFVMFVCLAVLEDSGYMARAAFVMDRFMRTIGLPGKSFVPMLVGFGCTVPAVMATRTLESTRDRILTVFMTPFMSCGARLPVYALFGAAFFGAKSGLSVFSIYLAGGVLAVGTGLLMKNTLFKGEPGHFIMELPPYHAPRPTSIFRNAFIRLKTFITRAGKVVVICITLLGVLNNTSTELTFGDMEGKRSLLSAAGTSLTPAFEPMGIHRDNWQATVALFTGLFAKEAIVGTLNGLYALKGEEETVREKFSLPRELLRALLTIPTNLADTIKRLSDPIGFSILGDEEEEVAVVVGADESIFSGMRAHFTDGIPQIYAYLLFVLLYVPCMAAMGAIYREIGRRMALTLALYLTTLAWIVSTLVYQLFFARQALWIVVPIATLLAVALTLRKLGRKATAGSSPKIGGGGHSC